MMLNTLKMVGLALALSTAGTIASAATVTFGSTPTAAFLNPLADSTTGTVFENTTGSIVGLKRSPWQFSTVDPDAADSFYTSVSGSASATYSFAQLMGSVSFLWGSPDSFNNLELVLTAGGVSTVINGVEAQGPISARQQYITITDVVFDSLTFRSGGDAFEFANLEASPVPVPAAGLLLIGGLGMMAALRRRQKAA